jgi:protein ImuB
VEDTAADTVVLDLAGLERIFGPPAKMARDMARCCSEMGLEANVAVASNADTAVLAARGFAGVTVIPEGKEAERLGELSVEVLCGTRAPACADSPTGEGACATPALEILDTLERWGVRNLRALAALPEVAVAERLGQDGLRLQKLARGATRRPLVIADPPLVFEEAVELEYPVDLLEPLAFVLNRMLEQLCARLAARALATNELTVTLELEPSAEDLVIGRSDDHPSRPTAGLPGTPGDRVIENPGQITRSPDHPITRCLRLPVPMVDPKVFLKLLQLDLQGHPPQAPVTKIRLRAEPAEPRRSQNGLFVPQAPEPERLELTMARIQRVVGSSGQRPVASGQENPQPTTGNQQRSSEARVGSSEIVDTHRADGFRMKPFTAAASVARVSDSGARAKDPGHTVTAFRVFRPPLPAVVTVREGRPVHIASPERPAMRGEVAWCAGPWRSSGEWWTEQPWSRQEWDVAVHNEEGVALYRIYCDDMNSKWFVQGTYD